MKLGTKKSGVFARLGQKIYSGGGALANKSEKVSTIAGAVQGVAGKGRQEAGGAATVAAMTGLGVPVASALGTVSAGAGALSKGAGVVQGVADRTTQARGALNTINRVLG